MDRPRVRTVSLKKAIYKRIRRELSRLGIKVFTNDENLPGMPYIRIEEKEDNNGM